MFHVCFSPPINLMSELFVNFRLEIKNFSPIGIDMRYNEKQRDKELKYFIKQLKKDKLSLIEEIEKRMNFYIFQAEYIEELIRKDNLEKK